jgi:hypothetical protein
MSSPHYNHPFWPSPRAARIAKMLLEKHEPPSFLNWHEREIWCSGRPVKPEGRLTHDKALKVMADQLGLTVHQFLHIQPADAILRLKLADTEQKAWSILGNTTLPPWWQWQGKMPCCYACERTAPVPAPPVPATVAPVRDPPAPAIMPALSAAEASPALLRLQERLAALAPLTTTTCECEHTVPAPAPATAGASDELIETLMEFLKEMNGMVTAGDQRYVRAMVLRYKGRVL